MLWNADFCRYVWAKKKSASAEFGQPDRWYRRRRTTFQQWKRLTITITAQCAWIDFERAGYTMNMATWYGRYVGRWPIVGAAVHNSTTTKTQIQYSGDGLFILYVVLAACREVVGHLAGDFHDSAQRNSTSVVQYFLRKPSTGMMREYVYWDEKHKNKLEIGRLDSVILPQCDGSLTIQLHTTQ